ncbi:hypothetical protein AQPE_2732 [Aquipluma nitroreducens]|uniref:Uncharacterized protein n=1 Tax=Aquipluma nitroreducens TaxID=2010828 RepID=A0A5K7SAR7_9BACT|nr:hypothetical protein [Aquipluma nitroreducens]BBE18569.1 hypothetical protein AQPE_2732 [Aquipluma nitroreducens]
MRKNPKPNSLPKSITTIDDVWEFFNYLHNVEGVVFHPEKDFNCYINGETHKPTYTKQEVKERNILMDKCFDVCSENNINIFEVGIEAQNKNLFGDKSIESKNSQIAIAVCILSADFVDDSTGEVLSFSKNKTYEILYDHPLWLHIGYPGYDSYLTFNRLGFEQYFRYAEEGEVASEIEVIKKNPHRDKRTSSKKTQSNVAVCILSGDLVDNDTGEVFEFSINKSYTILYDRPLYLHIGYPGDDSILSIKRWTFDEYFRYAEEGEISSDML